MPVVPHTVDFLIYNNYILSRVSAPLHKTDLFRSILLTLYEHIKIAEQRTIIQQYGDWYTAR